MARIIKPNAPDANEEFSGVDLESRTDLGKEFVRQFKNAIFTKRSTKIGEFTLDQILHKCKKAREDEPSCEEWELRDKYPEWTSMPVSIVGFKTNMLVSLMRETLVDVASAPFIIDPTPNPEIPDDVKQEIIKRLTDEVMAESAQVASLQQQAMAAMAAQGIDPNTVDEKQLPHIDEDELVERIRQSKIQAKHDVREHAKQQALLMQREVYDRTVEGGYRTAVLEFADDFALYPFGCIHGPFPVIKEVNVWRKNKLVEEKQIVWSFERVSPFDLFWTDDSRDTQSGTAVFIKKLVPYSFLYDARVLAREDKHSGYILEVLNELIEDTKDGKLPKNWTDFYANNPEVKLKPIMWNHGDNIEIVIRYGRFRGYDLKELGFTDLDDDKSYETKVVMCGGQVIQAQMNKNPGVNKRPVFTASFEHRNGSIAGIGLGQKLLGIHDAFRACIHLALYNLGLSSEPITELEFSRLVQYMPDEWIDDPTISPGMVIPADGDRMGNGSRAVKFTEIPNTTDQALRLAQYIFDMCHVISNIPAALHGQPVGSGANRTVRGLLTLQGNTLKPIQSSLINLDMGIIEPMVTLMCNLLVMYDDEFEYSGDVKVVAKGAASMVQREVDKQSAMENLQILGQLGEKANPELMDRAIIRLLELSDILEPGEAAFLKQSPAQVPPTGQGVPGQPPVDMNQVANQIPNDKPSTQGSA